MTTQPQLKRVISFPLITFYGIGTILGAGVYVLISKVAGESGAYAPLAFVVAAVVAAFTALSYAELSSRFPRSGGEAVYVQQAFSRNTLSLAVGCAVVLTGTVSAATITRGFVGYINVFYPLSDWSAIILFALVVTLIATWGVVESVAIAVAITLLELLGVVLVLVATRSYWIEAVQGWTPAMLLPEMAYWEGLLLGAFLAFYAYIGFEDMVNMAEEVKNPSRVMPRAIIWALVVTTCLYVLVAVAAVSALPIDDLLASDAPFAAIIERTGTVPVWLITLISLVAVTNGALVQIIMGGRVLYGLSRQGQLPSAFGRVSARTRTPVLATLVIGGLVALFALAFPIETLARITSAIILVVFSLVNLALLVIKRRDPGAGEDVSSEEEVRYPALIPLIGFVLCLLFLLVQMF